MPAPEPADAIRIDKWLWFARFFKTRSLATRMCEINRIRVNKRVVDKAHALVRVDDVLTFPQGRRIRVVRVQALGSRRGPAMEAVLLYEDLTPPEPPKTTVPSAEPPPAGREPGAGRPTKADRRAIDRLRDG